MKRNEIRELRDKPTEELQQILRAEEERLRNLKFDLAAGKVKNVGALRETKRAIARLLSFLRERLQK